MSRFKSYIPEQSFLLPPSVQDELSGDHLCFFIRRVVERLDLSGFKQAYAAEGGALYAPELMLSVWLYAYPPIAEAAHVSGVVNLTLIIGGDGKPFFVDVDSGPAMLVGSAKDAARRWQFAAIKARGAPVRWITHLVFDFTNSGVSKVTVAP